MRMQASTTQLATLKREDPAAGGICAGMGCIHGCTMASEAVKRWAGLVDNSLLTRSLAWSLTESQYGLRNSNLPRMISRISTMRLLCQKGGNPTNLSVRVVSGEYVPARQRAQTHNPIQCVEDDAAAPQVHGIAVAAVEVVALVQSRADHLWRQVPRSAAQFCPAHSTGSE